MSVYILFFQICNEQTKKYTNTQMRVYSDLEKLKFYLLGVGRINDVTFELEDALTTMGFYWVKCNGKYVGRVEKKPIVEFDIPS